MLQRLQKALAAAGVGSRRHCEALIATGRVAIDGEIVTQLGTKVDADRAKITVDGKPLQGPPEKLHILLNKPVGYTCTRSDPHAKHTVIELVPEAGAFLYPVGRLDVNTSGLLILTNDGELANLLTHPSHRVEKTYTAVVRGRVAARALRELEKGVAIEDGVTAPARARLISYTRDRDTSNVELTVHEGRKRQVRRMLEAVGHRVLQLARVRMGTLELGGLAEGRYRRLTKKEVSELRKGARSQRSEVRSRKLEVGH